MADIVNIVVEEVTTEIHITVSELATIGYTAENVANKAINFVTSNNTLYPTVKAVVDFTAGAYAVIGHTHTIGNVTGLQDALDGKQATLVSATNIKTVNGVSLLGSGDLSVSASNTLLQISATSTTAPNSVYQMSAGIPVHFKSSDANTLFYLDETNERVGVGTASPISKFDVTGDINVSQYIYMGGTSSLFPRIGKSNTEVQLLLADGSGRADLRAGQVNTTNISNSATGIVVINTNTYVNSSGRILTIPIAPTASANYGLVSFGSGAFDGSTSGFFTGSSSGTLIAGNLATGSTSDLMNLQVGGSSKFKVDNVGNATAAKYFISALNTAPSSASDTGTLGEIRYTNGYLYLCTAANTWLRAALTTW